MGDRAVLERGERGLIKWVGELYKPEVPAAHEGLWVGLKLDAPRRGATDGVFGGRRLFHCADRFGVLAPATRVVKYLPRGSIQWVLCGTSGTVLPAHVRIAMLSSLADAEEHERERRERVRRKAAALLRRSYEVPRQARVLTPEPPFDAADGDGEVHRNSGSESADDGDDTSAAASVEHIEPAA